MQELWPWICDQSQTAQFYGLWLRTIGDPCHFLSFNISPTCAAVLQTYKDAILEPGPSLNLVLGPNGGHVLSCS